MKTMDELPELPFELVLSYLSLGDLLRSRAVSRGWRDRINRSKVKSLCCSNHPSGFITGKKQLLFFDTYATTILSDLKHLRLCKVTAREMKMPVFFQTINSFTQLEELDIIRFDLSPYSNQKIDVELSLPMLRNIQLCQVDGIGKLHLDTPKLNQVKIWDCYSWLRLDLVHSESVERLLIRGTKAVEVKQLKNLRYLNVQSSWVIDETILCSLQQLREIHVEYPYDAEELFEQKQRYGRTDLKIYRFGYLLDDPEDPLVSGFEFFNDFNEEFFVHLAENPSKQADEMPLFDTLRYTLIENIATELAVSLLNLREITVEKPIQKVESFLLLLKSLDSVVRLEFECDQPELFDRLPEHCAVQWLTITDTLSDFRFLFRLRDLTHLYLYRLVDSSIESVSKVLKLLKLPFISTLYIKSPKLIEIDHLKRFEIKHVEGRTVFEDANAAIQFIVEDAEKEEAMESEESEKSEEGEEIKGTAEKAKRTKRAKKVTRRARKPKNSRREQRKMSKKDKERKKKT